MGLPDDLEDLLDDSRFAEFGELGSLHDLSGSDADFKALLRNEAVSFWSVCWTILSRGPFWNLLLVGILFFGLRKLAFDQPRAAGIAVAAIAALNVYEIIAKLAHEEII